jgi:hypothetical protein
MALMDSVKKALRLTTNAFDDDELEPLILACKKDLKLAGVDIINDDDALVNRAAVLYAKANFGYDEDGERYRRSYEALKNSMALSGDYTNRVK